MMQVLPVKNVKTKITFYSSGDSPKYYTLIGMDQSGKHLVEEITAWVIETCPHLLEARFNRVD